MSRTTMYAAPENGSFIEIAAFRNSWGSATFIWNRLCGRYLGDSTLWLSSDQEKQQRLWDLAKDDRLEDFERQVLMTTYDKAMVHKDQFRRLAAAFRLFVQSSVQP